MKLIVVPIDFSINSLNAFQFAVDLFDEEKIRIHLVHVVDTTITSSYMSEASNLLAYKIESSNKLMKEFWEKSVLTLKESKPNTHFSKKVVFGTICRSIEEEAKEVFADLIIVGSHGETKDIHKKILGSTVTRLISDAKFPIMVIPENCKFKSLVDVLFPTKLDYGDIYEIWRVNRLLVPHSFIVRCLHVLEKNNKEEKRATEEFSKYIKEHSPGIQTVFYEEENNEIEKVISEYVQYFNIDLIIMPVSRRSFFQRIINKDHIKKTILNLSVPLLVLNNQLKSI